MAEPTMDEVVNVEEELQPCDFCGRTFLPRPLEKHIRVCQSNATKKRKVFDSQKQRVDGTELASFQLPTYHKKQSAPTSESLNKPSKWKEKHIELVNAIRAARNVNVTVEMSSSTTTLTNPTIATSGGDRCPSCDRQFGPRAFDRHVEWCKERNLRVQKSPADVLLAKERLAARTKYKVPLPTKSKRTIIKEKYSPTLGSRTDSFTSVKSISCATLERAPSTNKSKTAYKKPEITVYDHGDATVVTEETKKTEKPAKDKKTLPEIKPALDPKSVAQSDYNPFLTAERQLMELLECDDFKPFLKKSTIKPLQRPHTVNIAKANQNKHTQNKVLKSAENARKKLNYADPTKRASVIDPPSDFQDGDDFEIIENPRLINENDNLAIPKNLMVDSSSSSSSNGHVKPLVDAMDQVKIETNSNNLARNSTESVFRNNYKTIKPVICNTRLNLKKQPKHTSSTSTLSLTSSFVPSKGVYDKKRSVNTIKRSVSIRESVNKPHLKNKQDVEQYFNQQDKKKADRGLGIHNSKVEDLFSIDDEMYEEYKKYEELYLKERQLQNQNTEIPLNELADYDDTEFFGTNSTPKSNTDSAYNSLNRSNPKIRSQLNKLNPLEYQKSHVTPEGSASSSSSETNAMSKLKKRISKFCHECGSKYPIETAKFCVECGVKRLSL
ncbi:hypothetical protein RN001_014082 [Aquatica leii]|uniref:C2HC/C3H-type domain-containing protein n=1 Tax=Aquatica leii TaxID=1421715 RepID=A0AAN7P1K7_9COLE|nr:hypothetical protein RN001_014082 [Aquatica leii]